MGAFVLQDIRDLLRYQKTKEDFEELCRRTHKPVLTLKESPNRAYWMALNTPRPSRLTIERAAALPVYRRLMKESLEEWDRALDEETLLLLVGEVADRNNRTPEDLWPLLLEEFGRLMDKLINSSAAAPSEETARFGLVVVGEETRGGRPGLADSTDRSDQLKRNVYDIILARKKPGVGAKGLLPELKGDKDFLALVKEAGLTLGDDLIRAATEYKRRNVTNTKHET